jgi:crossover junction endodeoxyribonuclease RusA
MNVIINLPWPPTVNSYYSHTKRGVYISKGGRSFRDAVSSACNEQLALNLKLDYRLSMMVILYPPDQRTRDLDNYMKALLDALTKAGVWIDDEQIDELHIMRGKVIHQGKAAIQISHHHGMIMPDDENVWDFLE